MKVIAYERNLNNTAQFLINEIGGDFEGLNINSAIDLLKMKTKQCFETNTRALSFDRVVNGESIWGCYKGVCCLFTVISGGNGIEIFTTNDKKDIRIDVTYHSAL